MDLRYKSRGLKVKALQRGLSYLGFPPGAEDGIYGRMVEEAVEDLQEKRGIYPDGVFGELTHYAYMSMCKLLPLTEEERAYVMFELDDGLLPSSCEWERVDIKTPPDVPKNHTFYHVTLREDAARDFETMCDELYELGGFMTSSGGRRKLLIQASKTQSKTSLHYLGLAFDLALPTIMQGGNFVCVRDEFDSRRWTVYARASDGLRMTLMTDQVRTVDVGGKLRTQIEAKSLEGTFVNFTELASKYGFTPIRCRRSFLKGGPFLGAEVWHFSYTKALTRGRSRFGEELLRVYSREEAERFVYWDMVKDAVYGYDFY